MNKFISVDLIHNTVEDVWYQRTQLVSCSYIGRCLYISDTSISFLRINTEDAKEVIEKLKLQKTPRLDTSTFDYKLPKLLKLEEKRAAYYKQREQIESSTTFLNQNKKEVSQ